MSSKAKYANLRNDSAFPSFGDLPAEDEVDLDYYVSDNGFSFRPRKHWCFLAEIVDMIDFMRLTLDVKDKHGAEMPVMFYTDGRGREMDRSTLKKGFTVAVLYAEQHGFLDMRTGIRHEEQASLKIFPISLNSLLELSDKVQQLGGPGQTERSCQACGKKDTSLKKCAKCGFFWYCDQNCQVAAWNEMGHKADCKLLRDPDLRMLFHRGTEGFDRTRMLSFS